MQMRLSRLAEWAVKPMGWDLVRGTEAEDARAARWQDVEAWCSGGVAEPWHH